MGKANLRPVFGPLVSCICTLTTTMVELQASENFSPDERDAMMVELPEFYQQALARDANVPEEIGAMAACLSKGRLDMTDKILGVVQAGIDRVDYEDLQPYFDVLKVRRPLCCTPRCLPFQRMH
jgi:hypothetical protein